MIVTSATLASTTREEVCETLIVVLVAIAVQPVFGQKLRVTLPDGVPQHEKPLKSRPGSFFRAFRLFQG
ncbi:hypothetical protein [Rhodothermus marinus]|uniref:hypothetical protein n=1 Tax=Rhodothermus marinus TaxID=29549 RepID=UPI001FB3C237|nr:hypothetical protein [Rhodothermus marinus]